MNWVDLIVLAVIAVSALLGLARGLVREVLGLAAWLCAGWAAYEIFPRVQPLARHYIANPEFADPVAYIAAFVVFLILFSLLANLVGRLVRFSALGGLDRTLGLVFGIGRGAVLVVAAYILGGLLVPAANWPAKVQEARSLPLLYQGAVWAVAQLPPQYRPTVTAPPEARQATASELLHANPAGRALGPPTTGS